MSIGCYWDFSIVEIWGNHKAGKEYPDRTCNPLTLSFCTNCWKTPKLNKPFHPTSKYYKEIALLIIPMYHNVNTRAKWQYLCSHCSLKRLAFLLLCHLFAWFLVACILKGQFVFQNFIIKGYTAKFKIYLQENIPHWYVTFQVSVLCSLLKSVTMAVCCQVDTIWTEDCVVGPRFQRSVSQISLAFAWSEHFTEHFYPFLKKTNFQPSETHLCGFHRDIGQGFIRFATFIKKMTIPVY